MLFVVKLNFLESRNKNQETRAKNQDLSYEFIGVRGLYVLQRFFLDVSIDTHFEGLPAPCGRRQRNFILVLALDSWFLCLKSNSNQ